MDQEELVSKLRQIEEQAQLTLAEFPQTLTKERQQAVREPAATHSIEDITPLGRA